MSTTESGVDPRTIQRAACFLTTAFPATLMALILAACQGGAADDSRPHVILRAENGETLSIHENLLVEDNGSPRFYLTFLGQREPLSRFLKEQSGKTVQLVIDDVEISRQQVASRTLLDHPAPVGTSNRSLLKLVIVPKNPDALRAVMEKHGGVIEMHEEEVSLPMPR